MTTEQQPQQTHSWPLGFLFSFKGRISRVQFLIGLGVIVILAVCLLAAAAGFMDPRGGVGLFIPMTIILLIVVAWIHSAIVVQRVRDAGHPGWFYFIFGPGPFLLLLAAEYTGTAWSIAVALALLLVIAPAFFPRESERLKAE
jgi:uncharacterized membrane protein YhaH (DUF805 family)